MTQELGDIWVHVRRASRLAANSATAVSAVLIAVCRGMQDVGRTYQITAYVAYCVWFPSFSAVFVVLLGRQSTTLRKKLYACFAFILALHLLGFGLRTESPLGELASFGPLAATASAFIMSVMFEANLDIIAALQEA
jgi:hypothetical protein